MSIYFFETNADEQNYLTEQLPGETLYFRSSPLTSERDAKEISDDAEIVSPFINSHLSAGVIDTLTQLKLIATRSTGFDHINVPSAESRGILVSNVPTYGENTVAEHTFALILALSRNIHKAYVRTTSGNFSLSGLQGFDLKGKTIGVVGTGHIGKAVIGIAKGFGMNVVAYDPVPDVTASEWLNYRYTTLEELLQISDIVTLHAPLTPKTQHLIGRHNLDLFKKGALLINTARGELLDTQALIYALDHGMISGAGLDVLEGEAIFSEEKQLFNNPNATEESLRMALSTVNLLRRDDLVITPHIAFDSREGVKRLLDTTIANIKAFRNGAPQNVVHT